MRAGAGKKGDTQITGSSHPEAEAEEVEAPEEGVHDAELLAQDAQQAAGEVRDWAG